MCRNLQELEDCTDHGRLLGPSACDLSRFAQLLEQAALPGSLLQKSPRMVIWTSTDHLMVLPADTLPLVTMNRRDGPRRRAAFHWTGGEQILTHVQEMHVLSFRQTINSQPSYATRDRIPALLSAGRARSFATTFLASWVGSGLGSLRDVSRGG